MDDQNYKKTSSDLISTVSMPIFDGKLFPGIQGPLTPDRYGYQPDDHSIWVLNVFEAGTIAPVAGSHRPVPLATLAALKIDDDEDILAFIDRITLRVRLPSSPIFESIDSMQDRVLVTCPSPRNPGVSPSGSLINNIGLPVSMTAFEKFRNQMRSKETRPLSMSLLEDPKEPLEEELDPQESRRQAILHKHARIWSIIEEDQSMIRRRDPSDVPKSGLKVGRNQNSIVVDDEGVRTHAEHPEEPGFSFGPWRSLVRHGQVCATTGDFTSFQFRLGSQILNPLGNDLASSVTDPLRMVVPGVAVDWIQGLIGHTYRALVRLGIRYTKNRIRQPVL